MNSDHNKGAKNTEDKIETSFQHVDNAPFDATRDFMNMVNSMGNIDHRVMVKYLTLSAKLAYGWNLG